MRIQSSFVRVALWLVAGTSLCVAQAQPTGTDGRVAKLYNLGELVKHVDAHAELRLSNGTQPPTPEQAAVAVSQNATNPAPIARLMRSFVQPALLANEEVTPVGDRWIVAICRAEQHAWIDRFLKAAKDNAKNQAKQQVLSVDVRCYSVSEFVFLRDVKPSFVGLGGVKAKAGAERKVGNSGQAAKRAAASYLSQVLAPGDGTTAFLEGLEKNKGVTSIHSPTITVFPLNVGRVSVIKQTAYVRDFDLEVVKAAFIINPIIDVIQDGIVLNAAVAPLENGMLGVSLDAHVADLKRPIETHELSLGVGQKVTVQLPSVQSTQIEAAVALAPGHLVVLAPPPLSGTRTLFVVDVKPVMVGDLKPATIKMPRIKLRALQMPPAKIKGVDIKDVRVPLLK